MNSQKALGKGLDALFGGVVPEAGVDFNGDEVLQLEIAKIEANPDQPRRVFDDSSIQELAISIGEHGVLQPLIVTKTEQNNYSIIAGERRFRASKLAGLKKVPVIVRTASELQKLELGLIENIQREDLTALDQAASIQRLHDQFSMSYEAISKRLGKAYSTVANLVRLLQLPEYIQKALNVGSISEGHARALLSLSADPKNQRELFNLIIKKQFSVRQAEQYVVAHRNKKPEDKRNLARTVNETADTRALSKHFGVKVQVNYMAKGGKLTMRFNSDDELQKLVRRLSDIR